ncbi:MAG: TetR family transcriptional regulator [Candidatus Dormibacteria bacterium]
MERPTDSDRPRGAPRLASGGSIREAAAALVLEKGYQATSLDEIAARSGALDDLLRCGCTARSASATHCRPRHSTTR